MDEKVKFTEDSYEKALIDLFIELGYEYECGYILGDRDEELPYYDGLVWKCLQRLNPQLGETGIENLLNTVTYIEGGSLLQKNETFTKWLQNGVIVENEENEENSKYRNVTARIVDFDNIENNDFRIVNQWTVEEKSRKRCDIVVFLNGLPIVVIELKSPSNESVDDDDAFNQIKTYQREIPSLFGYNCFNVTQVSEVKLYNII